MTATAADLSPAEAGVPRARQMLQRAHWAARAFATYDHASVLRIVEAVTLAAEGHAAHYAQWEVTETGRGVVADKAVRNRLCSRGLLDAGRDHDFVTPRVDDVHQVVELPRPAGVVLAVTPSTTPVSTLSCTVILALLTRNAVVVSPHPDAGGCTADAARMMAEAAVAAGAPDGVVQVVDQPSPGLVDALARDDRTDVVLATDGVRGRSPGNVPVLVDATADVPRAAATLVASKAFDNSLVSTSESVLVVEEAVADQMVAEMERHGARVLDPAERDQVRDVLFPEGRFDPALVGQDATLIAARAGVRVEPRTRILVAPFDLALDEEPLAHEKPCPVLGLTRAPSARRGLRAAAAVVRIGGAARCACIHTADPRAVMNYAAMVDVPRVVVNEGGSSLGEDQRPEHLVRTALIACGDDASQMLSSFEGIVPWTAVTGPVPPYPVARTSVPGAPEAGGR